MCKLGLCLTEKQYTRFAVRLKEKGEQSKRIDALKIKALSALYELVVNRNLLFGFLAEAGLMRFCKDESRTATNRIEIVLKSTQLAE